MCVQCADHWFPKLNLKLYLILSIELGTKPWFLVDDKLLYIHEQWTWGWENGELGTISFLVTFLSVRKLYASRSYFFIWFSLVQSFVQSRIFINLIESHLISIDLLQSSLSPSQPVSSVSVCLSQLCSILFNLPQSRSILFNIIQSCSVSFSLPMSLYEKSYAMIWDAW